jgi:hypothetical protein
MSFTERQSYAANFFADGIFNLVPTIMTASHCLV